MIVSRSKTTHTANLLFCIPLVTPDAIDKYSALLARDFTAWVLV